MLEETKQENLWFNNSKIGSSSQIPLEYIYPEVRVKTEEYEELRESDFYPNKMTEKNNWSFQKTKELIYLLESHECLWNDKIADFMNREKRINARNLIVSQLGDPTLTEKLLQTKISSLIATFKKELKLVENSKKNGESIYNPTVYWWPLLQFLVGPAKGDDSIDNLVLADMPEAETPTKEIQETEKKWKPEAGPSGSGLKKKRKTMEDEILENGVKFLKRCDNPPKEDVFQALGNYIVSSLHRIETLDEQAAHRTRRKLLQIINEADELVDSQSSAHPNGI